MKSMKPLIFGVMLAAMAGATAAQSGGGCLQGTWTYYDAAGNFVGYETVGCGADDGVYGQVTANRSFSQGCASPI